MKNYSGARIFTSAIAGLAALVGGINNGCNSVTGQKPVEGDIPGLPAENVDTGRNMTLYEKDLQEEPFSIILGPDTDLGGTANFTRIDYQREENGREFPFNAILETSSEDGGEQKTRILISDNINSYVNGDDWTFTVRGTGRSEDGRAVNYTETTTVKYISGWSNSELGNQIDDLGDRVGDLEEGVKEGYDPDDGICERGFGENEFNSPQDCAPTDNGEVDSGLEKALTTACTLPRAQDDLSTLFNETHDIIIYEVTPNGVLANTFTRFYAEEEGSENGRVDFRIPSGVQNNYFIASAGSGFVNNGVKKMYAGFGPGSNSGYFPQVCDHAYIINPEIDTPILPGILSITTEGEGGPTISHDVRAVSN